MVTNTAVPTAPPKVRKKFDKPAALVISSPSKPSMINEPNGIKKNGMPMPNKNRVNMMCVMVESGVSKLEYHAPNANKAKPVAIK